MFIKIVGIIIYCIGMFIILYPLFKIYNEGKSNLNALLKDIIKTTKYSDKKVFIGLLIGIIGGIIAVW